MKTKVCKDLSKKETATLAKVLDKFEQSFGKKCEAQAEMFDYDLDYIDIEVSFSDTNQVEQFKLEREILSRKMSLKKMMEEIY